MTDRAEEDLQIDKGHFHYKQCNDTKEVARGAKL